MKASFKLSGELLRAEQWQSFEIEIKAPASETYARVAWKQGDELPKIEVKKAGQVVMNTPMAKSMMDMSGSLGGKSEWLTKMLPSGGLKGVR